MTKKEELIKKFKKKHGRNPPKLSLQQISLLTEAFTNCANDKEAYTYAGICKANFYFWQKINPEFVDRKAALKDLVKYKAKSNIVKGINEGETSASKWWLERKNKEEFSLRVENTGKDGEPIEAVLVIKDDIKRGKDGK